MNCEWKLSDSYVLSPSEVETEISTEKKEANKICKDKEMRKFIAKLRYEVKQVWSQKEKRTEGKSTTEEGKSTKSEGKKHKSRRKQ